MESQHISEQTAHDSRNRSSFHKLFLRKTKQTNKQTTKTKKHKIIKQKFNA